jgi:hypothetical protein
MRYLVLALLAYVASGWHDARAILVPPRAATTFVRLDLPQDVDGGPGGAYPDARIADDQNREVAYALDADPGSSTGETAVSLSDVGFVAGRYTQAIADLGRSGALYSTVRIVTSQPTFFEHVDVATSDDRGAWTIVQPDALIYRVAETNDTGTTVVPFGPSRARWLRVRVLDTLSAFPIDGIDVVGEIPPPRLVPLFAGTITTTTDAQTTVTLDLGTPNTNLGALAVETRTPQFSRQANVWIGDVRTGDEQAWQQLSSVTFSRFAAGSPSLVADLGNQHARLVRVTIVNGNDAPLLALHVTALGYQHHVVFAAAPGVTYRLLWGNPDAAEPTYDLADRLGHESWSVGAVASLGAPAATAFVPVVAVIVPPATPWLQKAALPLGLAIACVLLGTIALVALRPGRVQG